jgi:hypothetical protein
MQSKIYSGKNYQGKSVCQVMSDVKHNQWLEDIGSTIETAVSVLNKDSCTCLYVQSDQWPEVQNDLWLEELGNMMESTVIGLEKDSCNCHVRVKSSKGRSVIRRKIYDMN